MPTRRALLYLMFGWKESSSHLMFQSCHVDFHDVLDVGDVPDASDKVDLGCSCLERSACLTTWCLLRALLRNIQTLFTSNQLPPACSVRNIPLAPRECVWQVLILFLTLLIYRVPLLAGKGSGLEKAHCWDINWNIVLRQNTLPL